jgi:hypothetical protein
MQTPYCSGHSEDQGMTPKHLAVTLRAMKPEKRNEFNRRMIEMSVFTGIHRWTTPNLSDMFTKGK